MEGMNTEVRKAQNGITLRVEDDEPIVFQDNDYRDEYDRWQDFLCTLTELYGPEDSRFNPKRIYIIVAPGDKSGIGMECPLRDEIVCPYP